ncbi:MAG: hypothetical protein IJS67_01245 [Clostridia bacterium]|nr:hypothetical protein [Clostridia bacterium]
MLVTLSVFYALILLVFILSLNSEEGSDTTRFIVWSAIYGAFLIWYFVWLFILKKNNEKKIERYKKELERLSAESISKTMGAYAIYGADYIQKLKEKNEKLAPKPAAQAIGEQTEQDKPLND